ncbi:NADH-ubiquinone dehydrogenase [Pseudohoeflea coraliihabitans]|uniref:NADH-ubiquinone dehydrogenase n=1 Tax=Pseudohoeflea coraliihabitans TaxID=2860393 RepID=UPI00210526B0|nr:NADH-ubiquinone dehydrogenase [Pseudohoeflea sp. DP4N28-3]
MSQPRKPELRPDAPPLPLLVQSAGVFAAATGLSIAVAGQMAGAMFGLMQGVMSAAGAAAQQPGNVPRQPEPTAAKPVAPEPTAAKPAAPKPTAAKPVAKAKSAAAAGKRRSTVARLKSDADAAAQAVRESAPAAEASAETAVAATALQPEDYRRPRDIERPAAPDDLKAISGIGPKLEQVLNGLGVWTYAQIADWTPSEIAWVDDYLQFKGRIGRDDWISQAANLAGVTNGK